MKMVYGCPPVCALAMARDRVAAHRASRPANVAVSPDDAVCSSSIQKYGPFLMISIAAVNNVILFVFIFCFLLLSVVFFVYGLTTWTPVTIFLRLRPRTVPWSC